MARIREVDGLKRYVEGTSNFVSVSVVDARGSGARSGVQLTEPTIEQLLQEGVLRGLQDKPMVSHPVISTSLQEPVMVLAEPVRPGRGGAQGVVLVVASLGPLWNMTKEMGQEGLFDVYVVDGRGRLVAHSDPARLQGDLDVSEVEIVRQFLESGGRAGATVPFTIQTPKGNVVKMLGTYTAVPESSWGVIVQVEEDKAYYSAIQMRYQSLVLVALVTIAAIVFGTLFAGQISRPIQDLARGARRLAGGDYDTRVSVKSKQRGGRARRRLQPHGRRDPEGDRGDPAPGGREQGAVHGLHPHARQRHRREGPLHARPLRARGLLLDAHGASTWGCRRRRWSSVHLSGIIHDVGKIGIEDKILRKPAALTDDEYEIMKQHPRKGEHILEAVPLLKEMAGAGLMHHENWDGSGYPDGLKGEQIPLLGRIVSVADAFDAMTTDRPYSKAMTFEAALARLRFLAGKKFDAGCVDAIEKAAAAGDLTPAKAQRASVAARQARLNAVASLAERGGP